MPWKFYLANRLSEEEEAVYKEIYFNCFENLCKHVLYIIPHRKHAVNITLQTLVAVCNQGYRYDDETQREAQEIATGKCIALLQKEPGLREQAYKEARQSEDLVTAFMHSTYEEQQKMYLDHRAQIPPADTIDPARHWKSFIKQLLASRRPALHLRRIMAAAAVLIALVSAIVVYFSITSRKPNLAMHMVSVVTEPTLLLSDGTVIKLDSVPIGQYIAPGIPFMKTNTGLVYMQLAAPHPSPGTHLLSVPPGRRYRITLADNSEIHLNASSHLRFPGQFAATERWVAMKGEAFFKVNANPAKPFFVNVNDKLFTKVTGTTFNIRAYHDSEYIKTTLIEGSLAVNEYSGNKARKLRAGQQVMYKNGGFYSFRHPNTNQVMAWTNDQFDFDGNSIHDVMQEIGHWYNMHVKYTGAMPARTATGLLYWSDSLSVNIRSISILYSLQIVRSNDTLIVSPY